MKHPDITAYGRYTAPARQKGKPMTTTTAPAELRILSMGWGVQTWALAAMMANGDAPRVDHIVHADTGHERAETYAFARQWTPWLAERGCEVVTVRDRRADDVSDPQAKSIQIPAFTVSADTGKRGQVLRQCTQNWKIRLRKAFCLF